MRSAGVLLHPTSLPGEGPCGSLGAGARAWLDWLVRSESTLWQVLPLHPPGRDGSPYDSPSAFALDTRLIDIRDLVEDGILPRSALVGMPRPKESVDPEGLEQWHRPRVAQAAMAVLRDDPGSVEAFIEEQPWARDWGQFRALVDAQGGQGWWDLPAPYQKRHAGAMDAAARAHRASIDQELAAQLIVHRQWARVRTEAEQRGIRIIGDLPMFVARDGAEPWAHRDLFRLDPHGRPDPITGAPPDEFSEDGQVWNNPHYHWPAHIEQGFSWWIERFRTAMSRHHAVRVDHFRGLCAAWEVPTSKDAPAGRWGETPGRELLDAVQAAVPSLQAIAEDLGHITDEVRTLREGVGWPGMKVLHFAFDGLAGNPYLPPWTETDWVAAPGTHDNDTTLGWYESAPDEVQRRVSRWAETPHPCPDPAGALMRGAWSSEAKWAIVTLQDVLRLGSWSRMNTPGQREGCWGWRARALPGTAAAELAELARLTARGSAPRAGATQTEGV